MHSGLSFIPEKSDVSSSTKVLDGVGLIARELFDGEAQVSREDKA